MVHAGLSKTRHWVLGAAVAALCTFAYAKAPGMPHGGGSFGGQPHAGFQHESHGTSHMYGAGNGRGTPADRTVRAAHGTGGGRDGYGRAPRIASSGGGYRMDGSRNDNRGGFQYAGAITPVSAETRSVPRPPEDESMVRAGSIRADVARYNEERGATRPVARPPGYMSRPPEPSPYRN